MNEKKNISLRFNESFTTTNVLELNEKESLDIREARKGNKGVYPTFILDVSGTKWPSRNLRKYTKETFTDYRKSEEGIWSGIRSAVHNSGIPLLKHHRQDDGWMPAGPLADDAHGRVVKAEYLEDKDGNGTVRFYVNVFDEEMAEGLRNGKYADFSIGGVADSVKCSICSSDFFECEHWPGRYYDKKGTEYKTKPSGKSTDRCLAVMGRIYLDEFSSVNVPGYAHTKVVGEEDGDTETAESVQSDEYKVVDAVKTGQSFQDNDVPLASIKALKEKSQQMAISESVDAEDETPEVDEPEKVDDMTSVDDSTPNDNSPADTEPEEDGASNDEQPEDKPVADKPTEASGLLDRIIEGLDSESFGRIVGKMAENVEAKDRVNIYNLVGTSVLKTKSATECFDIILSEIKSVKDSKMDKPVADKPVGESTDKPEESEKLTSQSNEEEAKVSESTETTEQVAEVEDSGKPEVIEVEITEDALPSFNKRGLTETEIDKTNLKTSESTNKSSESGYILVSGRIIELERSES